VKIDEKRSIAQITLVQIAIDRHIFQNRDFKVCQPVAIGWEFLIIFFRSIVFEIYSFRDVQYLVAFYHICSWDNLTYFSVDQFFAQL
jgi:hypothetical protein